MNADQRNAWIREALDMAFDALASYAPLRDALVYKGGRVLAIRLGGDQRASYDLDANVLLGFAKRYPSRREQADVLRDLFSEALSVHVESQDPVRYALQDVRVVHTPRDHHPLGWDAFSIEVRLADAMHGDVRGLPRVQFDVAAPETLGYRAVAPLEVGEGEVLAYTLERIAGEKHRAFLSSLPQYHLKVKKPGDAVRVKDLYDIAKILRARPIEEIDFWMAAAEEFRLACASRYVDCMGIDSFSQELGVTQGSYIGDSTLPSDVSWDDAWNSVESIVRLWASRGVFPLAFDMPTISVT